MEKQYSNTLADKRALEDFMGFLGGDTIPNPSIQIPLRPEENVQQPIVNEPIQEEPQVQQPEPTNSPVTPPTQQGVDHDQLVNKRLNNYIQSIKAAKVTPNVGMYDQMASDMEAANAANREDLSRARESDDRTRLMNNIAKIGGQLNESFANRSGRTNIKVNPLQLENNAISQAQEDSKSKLSELAQRYQMMQAKDKAFTDAQATNAGLDLKAAGLMLDQARFDQDRALKLQLAEMKKKSGDDLGFKEKEEFKQELKDSSTEKKENRKIRQDLDRAIGPLEDNLKIIQQAKAILKNNPRITGPIAGRLPSYSDNAQKFEKLVNNLSLNKMVTIFSGMSKAVDSEGERAKFESTVPNILDNPSVTMSNLTDLEEATKNLINKSKAAMSKFDRRGNWIEKETPSTSTSSKPTTSGKIRVSNGIETFEIDASDLKDAEKDGFKQI